ncbi:MAG: hypothetical protein HY537_01230 [Deltaproteobacteria bacterium]|nr:hypothetical protein [Deltaproteobacteria bacterium]
MVKLLVFLHFIGFAWAQEARVLGVDPNTNMFAASQPMDGSAWAMNQTLCIVRAGQTIACGKVIRTSARLAVAQFTLVHSAPAEGDSVVSAQGSGVQAPPAQAPVMSPQQETQQKRALASVSEQSEEALQIKTTKTMSIGVGAMLLNPELMIRKAVSTYWSVGVNVPYYSTSIYDVQMKGIGVIGSLNYHDYGDLSGFWLRGAAGMIFSNITYLENTSKGSLFMLIGTAGWRWQTKKGFNFGVGAGGMFYYMSQSTLVPFRLMSVNPVVTGDLSFAF